jgi:negative regulator of sigma E activity
MENKNHDADNDFLCAVQLQRIANALEEVLRLVKKDQEKYESYRKEKADEGNFADGR